MAEPVKVRELTPNANPLVLIFDPERSTGPTGTPDELREQGRDLSKVHSCCVGDRNRIKGCNFAKECSAYVFGLPENCSADGSKEAFGPQSEAPGAEGQGPRYVGYYEDNNDDIEREGIEVCHVFMQRFFRRMQNQRSTGERIGVIAGQGDVVMVKEKRLLHPGGRTITGTPDTRTVEEEIPTIVPTFPRPADVFKLKTSRRKRIEIRERMSMLRDRERIVAGDPGEGAPVAGAVPVEKSPAEKKKGKGDAA